MVRDMRRNIDYDPGFVPYTNENIAPWSAQGSPTNSLGAGQFIQDEMRQAAINELANKPRYDIDNRRYGNTIQDDMFAMKNPNYQGHTPESYRYLSEKTPMEFDRETLPVLDPSLAGASQVEALANQVATPEDFRDRAISRQKNITGDSVPWGTWDGVMSIADEGDPDSALLNEYLKQRAYREQQDITDDLRTGGVNGSSIQDDMLSLKNGNNHTPGEQSPRYDAWDDSYLDGALVNYNMLSPATLEQLAKMGVNRPVSENEDDSSKELMGLINAYKWAMEHGYR